MKLEDIQPLIHNKLAAQAAGLPEGVVIDDDGTYPKTPEREGLLNTKGLAVIVWEVESDGLLDVSRSGTAMQRIYVPVVIEENVKVNRSETGTKMQALAALRLVQSAISGLRPSSISNDAFQPDDTPFQNLGKINGVTRIVAYFTLNTAITPV